MKTPRLLTKYRKDVIPTLREKFSYQSIMAVPKISKVVINVGYGRISKETRTIERMENEITKITGQKPSIRKAKKSIAGFKLREGVPVGMVVTLHGRRMYDFIDRLISVALPRSRDFRGIDPKTFDQRGNLNLGVREHNIFPEASYESVKDIFGLEITIDTSARTREEGVELLRLMGFPVRV